MEKRVCPICNVRVIKSPKARTCRPCSLAAFKRMMDKIRERGVQKKRRKVDAE